MRKPRDLDAKLKLLEDKARDRKSRKVQQLGELVIAIGADALSTDELAGALIVLAETKDAGEREHGRSAAPHSFRAGRGELHRRLSATQAALRRNTAACNRHQVTRARHDMQRWQVERCRRTRHLIELGGLVIKAGIVDLTGDDRVTIYGALIWMASKLQNEDGEHARALWAAKGKQAFEAERKDRKEETRTPSEEAPHDEV